MNRWYWSGILGLLFCSFSFSQTYNVTCERKSNYQAWGTAWDSVYVMSNGIVTLAAVPKIGGRVMQYNLGTHASLYVDPTNKGKIPADGNAVLGGFRVLPSPQSDFEWPSPPALDLKPYTPAIVVNSIDSAVVELTSGIENSTDAKYRTHVGMQFKRRLTLYKASTRVKVDMIMYNKGTQSMTHGIWDITQANCAATADCRVYFQRNPTSTLGGGKGYVVYTGGTDAATQWKPDAAPGGIMEVLFQKKTGKIGADCRAGWICWNDRTSGYAYVKKFEYRDGATYPDSGASVQVYTYNNYQITEVEVLGPLVTLAPGDSTALTEEWLAARASSAILAVNNAGLITRRLTATAQNNTIAVRGVYGLFQPGKVYGRFVAGLGAIVATADSFVVTPGDSLSITKNYPIPAGAGRFELIAYTIDGSPVGLLDSASFPMSGVRAASGSSSTAPRLVRSWSLRGITVSGSEPSTVSFHTLQGALVSKAIATPDRAMTVPLPRGHYGTLVIRVVQNNRTETQTLASGVLSGR